MEQCSGIAKDCAVNTELEVRVCLTFFLIYAH